MARRGRRLLALRASADLAMVDLYLSSLAERAHPYASPLFAPKLDGVAPAYLINAEFDIRRDECEAYAVRLRDAGVQAVSRTMPGHVHGSFGLPNWPPAREWRAEANAVLASANAAARAGVDPPPASGFVMRRGGGGGRCLFVVGTPTSPRSTAADAAERCHWARDVRDHRSARWVIGGWRDHSTQD